MIDEATATCDTEPTAVAHFCLCNGLIVRKRVAMGW